MPAIELRPYQEEDASELLAVFVSAIRSAAARDYDADQIAAWSADRDLAIWAMRCGARPTYVAERAGVVAGFSDLEPDGLVGMLYVHADHQRQGVATALLAHVERQARRLDLARLSTHASHTARPVFQRQGFRVVSPQTVTLNGVKFVNFVMEKSLR